MSSIPSDAPDEVRAPLTETTFVATASGEDDPPPPVRGLPRLLGWILPANFAIFVIWGAVPGILLPHQIELLYPDEKQKVAYFAIVATIGALCAMIAQPAAGQISDRTRSKYGRRAPWILLGALAGGLSLVGLAFANSLVGIVIGWCLVQVFYNVAQGPLSAVLPDRVPVSRRGTFATLFGIGLMAGALGGQIVGAMLFDNLVMGYVFFAAFALLVLTLFVVFNPDHPSTNFAREPFRLGDFLRTFWVNPVKHPDFFWAFTGRLLLYTGYFGVTGYQLYILGDYLGVENPNTVIPVLGMVGLVGTIVATIISGPLSDRIGRRKPFVFGSSVVMGVALALPWIWPTYTSWLVMTAIIGFGFGMFQAVDTALISQVLPSAKSFAKDLGVVNIAATLPQTFAPGVAGAIVLVFGYAGLFPVGIVLSILGAFCVWFIKSAR
ncbi:MULTISPECIES: MFS transporter [Microbacterium]|uniref:MFS transporter n=1 Tax=Microbacterium resistens TaxID=156977 RepID=A0ABY3RSX3_9MICO|nr:MFS transporter [Microbacterium resistens]MBW1638864.1 SLC45 family MFS transporter [Microbacterium resistens]MDA4893389.1 MFS transporter [Streptomyces sp. MS2A]UGS25995.1 MFS transporter [Microbacterium resistens]